MKKTKDNYGKQSNYNDAKVSLPPGYVGLGYDTKGRNYSPAWGGQFAMGGGLPGATGFMYARTVNPAPSNGKYAKKTKASAKDGISIQDKGQLKKLDQLTNFTNYNDMAKAKSGININPANKGKFTATKKKTGKSTEELTHSPNALTRKRAIFAQNAKKWKRADDGFNFADALQNEQINLVKSQQETPPEKESTLTSILNAGKQLGGMLAEASSEEMRRGGYLPMAQGGGMFNIANAIGGAFTKPGTNGGQATGGLGDTMQSMFGGDPSAFGKANPAGVFGKGGVGTGAGNFGKGMGAGATQAGIGLLNAAPQILQGIGQMGEQKKAIKKANQMSQISGLTAQAAESRPERIKNQYVRPEDQMIQGLNPQGSGTNFLAAYGASIEGNPTEIQNTYSPGDLYSDLEYKPLNDSNVKQFQEGGKVISRDRMETYSFGKPGLLSREIYQNPNMSRDTAYRYEDPNSILSFDTNKGKPFAYVSGRGGFTSAQPDSLAKYKGLLSSPFIQGTNEQGVRNQMEALNKLDRGKYEYGGDLPTAEFGEYFQNSGQASIGKGAGSAIGSAFFGPVGGAVGGFLGGVAGNLLGGAKDARQLKGFEDASKANTERSAIQQGVQSLQSTYSASMEDGGYMNPQYNPQVIAKFGEYDVKDLLKPPYDADMLRSGGHLAQVNYTPPSAEAMFTGRRDVPYQMENGGYMAMGGDLEVYRGKAEPISYNPFLPDGGETVMFKGPSHDNGGMPISYGNNGVEVEGGEPAVKLANGGSSDGSLHVFGAMTIDDMAANHIGVEASKGKKYKSFINDLSKFESRQNKVVEKGTSLVNDSNTNDPFDQLTMNSGKAMMMGGNAKLLNAAIIKERAAGVQNAILDTAKEYGVKSDELSQGKFVIDKNSDMAKFGAELKKAQDGSIVDYLKGVGKKSDFASRKVLAKDMGIKNYSGTAKQNISLLEKFKGQNNQVYTPPTAVNLTDSRGPNYAFETFSQPVTRPTGVKSGYDQYQNYFDESGNLVDQSGALPGTFSANQIAKDKGKFDFKGLAEGVASNLGSLFRPSNQEGLDPNQLYPEMFALASNQLEPVNAQQYNPRLKESYNISLQDQLNEVDSQVRAATKQIGSNPSAAAQIFAQAADAKNKIRGEQFRMNQANQIGTQNANIDTLNQAQMQNLQLLDQQYVRQSQAKSNTKAQTLEALKSIASKTAQNKLENRQLGVMENMYNFRFGPNGQAYNTNNPYKFNIPEGVGVDSLTEIDKSRIKDYYEKIVSKDNVGNVTGSKEKTSTSKTSRNGSIVKALKSL